MRSLLYIVMLVALVFYFLTPSERGKVLRACRDLLRRAITEATPRTAAVPAEGGRRPAQALPIATWAFVLVNLCVFGLVLAGGGMSGDPDTLVSFGGSFGPRTTNGEWWRLVTATFVHAGPLHLLATLAGLIQIGCLTECLVGPFAFASIYLVGGTLGNLVCLAASPARVTVGGAGAVLAVYGLLGATSMWGLLRGSPVHLSRRVAMHLVPGAAFFLLYSVATGRVDRVPGAAVLAVGAISGFLLVRGAGRQTPPAGRVGVLVAGMVALIVVFAVPLRGMADVRPCIDRLIAMEDRTVGVYDAAVVRFNRGAIPAVALAQLIDRTILPQVEATRNEVASLERVPREHRPLVEDAKAYLRLRDDSWRLRSDALRASRMAQLREADLRQWQALDVFSRISERSQASPR